MGSRGPPVEPEQTLGLLEFGDLRLFDGTGVDLFAFDLGIDGAPGPPRVA